MITTQDEVIQSIPSYLRQFVVKQDYDSYTPQDQAVWRYIMRRNCAFLKDKAHEMYLEGLKKTGISLDKIPDINEMNACLSKIGWRAVVVDGFVPPAAFMEFQALKILVISAEIRNIKNILYTPAPDIVHEAAGHAPIIADPIYAEYLQRFGEVGMKSIFSKEDYEIYEAIRYLSIIKEYPDATKQEIEEAERDLEQKQAAYSNPSEANLLSRMHWWTVEYGLVGSLDSYSIFGAGLLSSVGESKHCLSDEVKKLPLTTDCVRYNYDITEMQPQLFVARDFHHLQSVLEEFASKLGYQTGSLEALEQLKASENVGTVELKGGIQYSGVLDRILTDEQGKVIFLSMKGETECAYKDTYVEPFGRHQLSEGLGIVVGKLQSPQWNTNALGEEEMVRYGVEKGMHLCLVYESGLKIEGTLSDWVIRDGLITVLVLQKGNITYKNDVLSSFTHSYPVALQSEMVSVYSGSADKEHFNVYPPKSERKAIKVTYSEAQKKLFTLYTMIREMRDEAHIQMSTVEMIKQTLDHNYPEEWLLRLEILEILKDHHIEHPMISSIHSTLLDLTQLSDQHKNVIDAGLKLVMSEEAPVPQA